ncbi:MAG: hypothetical protein HYX54_10060 [Chloroflexi bacterium]|nr:hypothetical protein [Chloroflexota bacterium]
MSTGPEIVAHVDGRVGTRDPRLDGNTEGQEPIGDVVWRTGRAGQSE